GTPYRGAMVIDLGLEGWNIHVGFPADWCTIAQDILNQTRAALGSERAQVNVFVKGQILQILQKPPVNLNPAQPSALLNRVSISFSSITFPNKHTWPCQIRTTAPSADARFPARAGEQG